MDRLLPSLSTSTGPAGHAGRPRPRPSAARLAFALLVVPALLAAPPPPAHATEPLSLERAIALALAEQPALRAADARIEEASARVDEAEGARLPTLALEEVASRTTDQVGVFGGLLRQERFGPENFAIDFLNEPDPLTDFATRVVVEQPLYTGGRIAHGVEAARAGVAAASAGREAARQRVISRVVAAYSSAVLAESQLEVAREAKETASANVALVADLFEAGLVVQSDLLSARVRESEIEERVIAAENGVAVARAALNLAMGLPLGREFTLEGGLPLAEREARAIEELEARALAERPDLRALERQLEAKRAMVGVAKAGRLPTVGLGASWAGHAEDAPGVDGSSWSVALSARFEAFDGGRTRARVRASEAEAARAAEELKLARLSASLEVREAWHGLRAAQKRLDVARAAVEMARESLKTVEDRYREGLVQLVELLDAETALTDALTREVAARRDVLISRTRLDLAAGLL